MSGFAAALTAFGRQPADCAQHHVAEREDHGSILENCCFEGESGSWYPSRSTR